MTRKPVLIAPDDPHHISARCLNKEWFGLPLPIVWNIMEDYLFLAALGFDLRIHSFVLMSNHFHLLATAPKGNLSEVMAYFMRQTSREITRLTGRINQTYGTRHHKSRIGNYHYFMNAYKYVYRNPVRAGICSRVEEYPYSTLNGLLGFRSLAIPMTEDTILFPSDFDNSVLTWLNETPDSEAEEDVRLALKKCDFKFTAKKKNGKQSVLETSLL